MVLREPGKVNAEKQRCTAKSTVQNLAHSGEFSGWVTEASGGISRNIQFIAAQFRGLQNLSSSYRSNSAANVPGWFAPRTELSARLSS